MAFFANFKKSAAELKTLPCLCITAVLIALDLAIKASPLGIQVTDDLKISFAFVAVAAIGMLYGPTVVGLACVVTDVIGYMIKPVGGFSPLFTLVEVAGGVIYGCFLYNFSPVKLDFSGGKAFGKSLRDNIFGVLRIAAAKITVAVVCNLLMTPLFITIQKTMEAGTFNAQVFWVGFCTRVGSRVIKNLIEVPLHVMILLVVLFPIMSAYNLAFGRRRKTVG